LIIDYFQVMLKKLLNLIIVIVAVAALAGIVYIVFFYDFTGKKITNEEKKISSPRGEIQPEEKTVVLSSENQKDLSVGKREISESEIAQENLKRMAASFAERFGSFSNQSNYGNLEDLKIFMSAKMQAWSENYISREREINIDSSIYFGVITKSISSEIKKFDENSGTAEILVSTKKSETKGRENIANYYQNIILKFIKEKEVWKVDEANWQEKIYSRN